MNDFGGLIMGLLVFVGGISIGHTLGTTSATTRERNLAIQAKVGYSWVNPTNPSPSIATFIYTNKIPVQ